MITDILKLNWPIFSSDLLIIKFFTRTRQSPRNFDFLLSFVFLLHHPSYIFQATCWHLCKCCDRVRYDACKFCALSFCSKSCRVGETIVPRTKYDRWPDTLISFQCSTPVFMLFRTSPRFMCLCMRVESST